MRFRKLITYAMITGIIASQAPIGLHTQVKAAVQAEQGLQEQGQELAHVLNTVKSRVRVPEAFEEFSYDKADRGEETDWYFEWYDNENKKSIAVNSDSKGNIKYYRLSDQSEEQLQPNYLKSELKAKADAFLKRAEPGYAENLVYKKQFSYSSFNQCYSYSYQRMKNNIPVVDNMVTVYVNAVTGEVTEYESNLDYKTSFASNQGMISKDKASEYLKKELNMKLEYHMHYSEEEKKMKGKLLYLPNQQYFAVDAFKGTIYKERGDRNSFTGYGIEECKADDKAMKMDSGSINHLTEKEMKKAKELSGLITKEQALSAVKKNHAFYIDKDAAQVQASLYEIALDASKPDLKQYVWQISCFDSREIDYSSDDIYRGRYSAMVDAKTGKVLSFDAMLRGAENCGDVKTNPKLTEDEGEKKAEAFLKQYDAKLAANTKVTDRRDGYILRYGSSMDGKDTVCGGKVYIFTRVENGIECPDNFVRIGVDLVSGKVYDLDMEWYSDMGLEAPENLISAETARQKYLACDGYELVYELVNRKTDSMEQSKRESRLVYRTEISPSYIDAVTGQQVSVIGENTSQDGELSYNDVTDYVYMRDILMLADMGVGFKEDAYQPNAPITKKELGSLIFSLFYRGSEKDKLDGKESISRLDAARYILTLCGLKKVADLDVYQWKYNDAESIDVKDQGYLILADHLGMLVHREDGTIAGKDALTRGEAAHMLMKAMELYKR